MTRIQRQLRIRFSESRRWLNRAGSRRDNSHESVRVPRSHERTREGSLERSRQRASKYPGVSLNNALPSSHVTGLPCFPRKTRGRKSFRRESSRPSFPGTFRRPITASFVERRCRRIGEATGWRRGEESGEIGEEPSRRTESRREELYRT